MRKALQVIDVDGESIFKPGKTTFFEKETHQDGSFVTQSEDVDESDDSEDQRELSQLIDSQDMDEEQAMNFLAWCETSGKKRSWSENKLLKAARKKDRRQIDEKEAWPERPLPRRRLPIAELKKITRCSNCDLRGHWRGDCTRPYSGQRQTVREGRPALLSRQAPRRRVGQRLCLPGRARSSRIILQNLLRYWPQKLCQRVVLRHPSGSRHPGAAQDLIGEKHFEDLERRLNEVGVGGNFNAKVLKTVLSPCVLGGQPGLVRLCAADRGRG